MSSTTSESDDETVGSSSLKHARQTENISKEGDFAPTLFSFNALSSSCFHSQSSSLFFSFFRNEPDPETDTKSHKTAVTRKTNYKLKN